MRRRLLIARALVHRPRLLLLDEPTVGLDPQVRQELWALIDRLRSEGISILMSTHYIEEAERLADTVTIMSHGRAVAVRAAQRADRRARRPRGGGGLRAAGTAGRGGGARPRAAGLRTRRTGTSVTRARATGGNGDGCPRASAARPTSRTCSCCSPARRSREHRRAAAASRAGGCAGSSAPPWPACWCARSSTSRRTGARPPSRRRSSPPSTCWRSASASARWSRRSAGYHYVEFVGTGHGGHRGAVLVGRSRPCSGPSSSTSSSAPTTRSWPRRWTPRSWSPARRCGSRARAGVFGCTPMLVAMFFGLDPSWGMLAVPFIALHGGLRLGQLRASRSPRS